MHAVILCNLESKKYRFAEIEAHELKKIQLDLQLEEITNSQ